MGKRNPNRHRRAHNQKFNKAKNVINDVLSELQMNGGVEQVFDLSSFDSEDRVYDNLDDIFNDIKKRIECGISWATRITYEIANVAVENWYNDYIPGSGSQYTYPKAEGSSGNIDEDDDKIKTYAKDSRNKDSNMGSAYQRRDILYDNYVVWNSGTYASAYNGYVTVNPQYLSFTYPLDPGDTYRHTGRDVLKFAELGIHCAEPPQKDGEKKLGIWKELIGYVLNDAWGTSGSGNADGKYQYGDSPILDAAFDAGVYKKKRTNSNWNFR